MPIIYAVARKVGGSFLSVALPSAIAFSAMHIFVPTLPLVARHFGASAGAAQMTLSAYVIGLAVAQIAYGPISDRYGRRPVLILGMVIYALSTGLSP